MTDKAEPTIFDAVNAAVAEAAPQPAEEPVTDENNASVTDEGTGEENEESGQADGEGADEEGDGEEGESEAETDEGDGKKSDSDGKKSDDSNKKEPDHVNDPVPEGLKEQTRERITSLASKVKELAPVAQERDELLRAIESTGATPQQYAQTLQVLACFNSEVPEHRKEALGVLKQMVHELSVELNETVEFEPLKNHPDLQAEVEEKTLTPERATEIARGRERDKLANTRRQQQTEAENQQNATREAVANGKTDLNTLEGQLKARDGEAYGRKKAVLVPVLGAVMRQAHPSQWAAMFLQAYEKMPTPTPTALIVPPSADGGTPPSKKPVNQPLRAKGGQPAGNTTKAPTTAAEAVMQALRMG